MRSPPVKPLAPWVVGLNVVTGVTRANPCVAAHATRINPARIVMWLRCPQSIRRKVLVRCGGRWCLLCLLDSHYYCWAHQVGCPADSTERGMHSSPKFLLDPCRIDAAPMQCIPSRAKTRSSRAGVVHIRCMIPVLGI
jgi:hypothetical protein